MQTTSSMLLRLSLSLTLVASSNIGADERKDWASC